VTGVVLYYIWLVGMNYGEEGNLYTFTGFGVTMVSGNSEDEAWHPLVPQDFVSERFVGTAEE